MRDRDNMGAGAMPGKKSPALAGLFAPVKPLALVTVFAAFPSGLDSDLRLRSLLWSGSSR